MCKVERHCEQSNTWTGQTAAKKNAPIQGSAKGPAKAKEIEQIASLIGRVLLKLVEENAAEQAEKGEGPTGPICKELGVFYSEHPPSIPIDAYLERIGKYISSSPEALIVAFILVDRLLLYNKGEQVGGRNAHRLLIAAIVVAIKLRDDVYYTNKFYSEISGISLQDLNVLEMRFIQAVQYNLNVSGSDFEIYFGYIREKAPAC